MTRNLKAICLALLLAALATSALAVTGAFAEEEEEGAPGTLTAAEYPATLDGTDIAGKTNAFTLFSEEIVCPDSSYSGSITKAETEITITPTYNNAECSAGGGGHKVTVTMNGCDYQFHISGTTKKFKDNYYMIVDLLCPKESDVEIHKYDGMNDENTENCVYTIKEQKGIKGSKLTNETDAGGKTTGTFVLETSFNNIVATRSGPKCEEGETKVGAIDVNITFKGTNNKGAADKLEITDQ